MGKSLTDKGRETAINRLRRAVENQVQISRENMENKELYEGTQSDDYTLAKARHIQTEAMARVFDDMLSKQLYAIQHPRPTAFNGTIPPVAHATDMAVKTPDSTE